jgi:hypothetical protein
MKSDQFKIGMASLAKAEKLYALFVEEAKVNVALQAIIVMALKQEKKEITFREGWLAGVTWMLINSALLDRDDQKEDISKN